MWPVMGDFVLELLGTRSTQEESTMDRAASAGFEGIAQMLLEQKRLMDTLEAENRELRRQLADLRRGVGISLVIDGRTLPLSSERTTHPISSLSAAALRDEQFGRKSADEKQERTTVNSPLADSFVL